MLDNNTIVETKNAEFFEHIFPLSVDTISPASLHKNVFKNSNNELRRSKKIRKETSFGNDF